MSNSHYSRGLIDGIAVLAEEIESETGEHHGDHDRGL